MRAFGTQSLPRPRSLELAAPCTPYSARCCVVAHRKRLTQARPLLAVKRLVAGEEGDRGGDAAEHLQQQRGPHVEAKLG